MAEPVTHDLGAFAAGEIPPPLVLTFRDFNGSPVDLTTFTIRAVNIESIPAHDNLGEGQITVVGDPANGQLQYAWTANDMLETGEYILQAWVYNGSNQRYASDLYQYTVYDGPGEAPGV